VTFAIGSSSTTTTIGGSRDTSGRHGMRLITITMLTAQIDLVE